MIEKCFIACVSQLTDWGQVCNDKIHLSQSAHRSKLRSVDLDPSDAAMTMVLICLMPVILYLVLQREGSSARRTKRFIHLLEILPRAWAHIWSYWLHSADRWALLRHAISLVRHALSLLHRAMSLLGHAMSLLRHAISLLRHALSLFRHAAFLCCLSSVTLYLSAIMLYLSASMSCLSSVMLYLSTITSWRVSPLLRRVWVALTTFLSLLFLA